MNELELLAREAARKYGLDPRLICALCEVESSWNPWAVRHETEYKWLYGLSVGDTGHYACASGQSGQKLNDILLKIKSSVLTELATQRTSWGLLQIMGAVARERGFKGWLTELCDPAVNLEWGCKHLRWMVDHNNAYGLPDYRITPEDLAAAWNGGTRVVVDGKYKNQSYVDRVKAALVNYERS